jgi:V8-like Glu-specific endopeptidase
MRPTLAPLLLLPLCLQVGCGTGIELLEPEGRQARAIVSGETDSAHPAVGLLNTVKGNLKGICTATLVGTKTVLTAAHCVDGVSSATFKVGGKTYSATKAVKHGSYVKAVLNAYDVAVVVLAQQVTGVAPAPLSKTAPQVGEAITVVGYGITKSGLTDSGTKRVAKNAVSKVYNQYFRYSGAGNGAGNVCQGDSGGPTFRQEGGREVVIGVHSTASVPCGSAGNDMRIDQFYSWIEAQAGGDLGDTKPPVVTITEPTSGATLAPGDITVRVTAAEESGGSGVASIKLLVDGASRETATTSPASFVVSALPAGSHTLKVDATDRAGNVGSAQVAITVSALSPELPPGTAPGPSQPDKPPAPGSFGSSCLQSSDCDSGLCAADSYTGTSYCTRACTSQDPCPVGAECVPAGGDNVCAMQDTGGQSAAPREDGEVLIGSCSVAGSQPLAVWWPLLALLIGLLVRRRVGRQSPSDDG